MFSSRSGLVASAGLIALLATACGQADTAQTSSAASDQVATSTTAGGPLKVVATTTQVADFARNIGGDKVTVTQILKPNVDPHDYEPSPADIQAIADADVVVEERRRAWRSGSTRRSSSAGFDGTVVDASQGVTIRKGNGRSEESGRRPAHLAQPAERQDHGRRHRARLRRRRTPPTRPRYQANPAAYAAKLDALDAEIAAADRHDPAAAAQARHQPRRVRLLHRPLPADVRRLDHPQLRHLRRAVRPSSSPTSSPRSRQTGVTGVFSESSLPPKTAEAIGRQAGVQGRGRRGLPVRRHARPARARRGATYLGAWSGTTPTPSSPLKALPGWTVNLSRPRPRRC